MNLWHLVFRTDSLTYTVCRALRECGHEVSVWVVDPEFGARRNDNIQNRLATTAGVRIVGRDAGRVPATIDRLIVQTFPRPAEALGDVRLMASRASAVTLISAGDRSRPFGQALRTQWLEARSFGALLPRVDRVLYKDGFHRLDLFGPFRARQAVGFDAHSHFLHSREGFEAIHARDWSLRGERPYLASFLGSRDPTSRTAVLNGIRHLFCLPSGEPRVPQPGKRMFWHEYSDAEPAPLPPTEFVAVLTRSDFTLCPRGYSLVTHRPIEALLRGSIPVLDADDLDLYGVDLINGENCVAVAPGRWPEAIERLARMRKGEILRMRENVRALRDAQLDYGSIARGICARLGLRADAVDAFGAPAEFPGTRGNEGCADKGATDRLLHR